MTQRQLDTDIKQAMTERAMETLSVLRMLKSAVKNECIEQRVLELDEQSFLAVVKRMVKQTRDARADFEKAGRTELVEKADAELRVLDAYMPALMSEADIAVLVAKHKEALGVSAKSDMGKLMGAVMKEVAGRADGAVVLAAVEKALA